CVLWAIGACNDGAETPNDDLNDDAAFNEIIMRCTHNSYHTAPEFSAHPSHEYDHLPLDEQLDAGVRAFELDIHYDRKDHSNFPVFHIPYHIDSGTTCESLDVCLGVVANWSKGHATHHMLVVWIEIKDELDRGFIRDYDALDEVIRSSLGEHRLYTPKDFQRGHPSMRTALETDGWPTIGETRGKVMVVLLDTDEPHYEGYRAYADTTPNHTMFGNARVEDYEAPWAVVTKVNDPRNADAIAHALDKDLLVASNTGAPDNSDEVNYARLTAGLQNGAHMLCDDFPTPREEGGYWMDIPAFFPSGCNHKTA